MRSNLERDCRPTLVVHVHVNICSEIEPQEITNRHMIRKFRGFIYLAQQSQSLGNRLTAITSCQLRHSQIHEICKTCTNLQNMYSDTWYMHADSACILYVRILSSRKKTNCSSLSLGWSKHNALLVIVSSVPMGQRSFWTYQSNLRTCSPSSRLGT